MTTPTPPGGSLPASQAGNGILGGAAGTLGGTNVLQQSIDSLTQAVNTLNSTISSANFGAGSAGLATKQQGSTGTQPFPSMINPFQANAQQPGIGGGGPGGAGNVSKPSTFGSASYGAASVTAAAFSYGQNQMQPQLTLNQYATQSMLGMNMNGMSQSQAMQMLYKQAGATPGSSMMGLSPQDIIGMAASLQQLGGSALYGQTALGRAGFGATAGFWASNPSMGATQSSQLAAALYSQQFSMNALTSGYGYLRSTTAGGKQMNSAQMAQQILNTLGYKGMSASQIYGNLASGKGQLALGQLTQGTGLSASSLGGYLQVYGDLFAKGYSTSAANSLVTQAFSGTQSQQNKARATLKKLGITTASGDISSLEQQQGSITSRLGDTASGFNAGLQQSASLLTTFNNALNALLKGPLGSIVGYTGGVSGVLSGASTGTGIGLGLGGASIASKLLGLGGGAGGLGGALGGGAGGIASALGLGSLAVAAGALAWGGLTKGGNVLQDMGIKNVLGMGSSGKAQIALLQGLLKDPSMSSSEKAHLQHIIHLIDQGQSFSNSQITHMAGIGGGSGAVSSQQRTGGGNQLGSISAAAKAAVSAAESQLGVPYAWGDEIPGVGFDCSGLVQWAYAQAGVNLPRTSQEMWSSLKNRRVALGQVQEGDLVFTAGSDGTPNSPGHVGMMVSGSRLIQAPYTGADVQTVGYDPKAWIGAARPSGKGTFVSGSASSISGGSVGSSLFQGNRGLGGPAGNTYGSSEEVDLISAMGSGGGGFGSLIGASANGASGSPNTNASAGAGSVATPRGKAGLVATAKKIAQQYGWSSGNQWEDFLRIVNHEDASWSVTATNSQTGAYGIPQALPGSKMASAGADWRTNAATQLKWMFGYIKGRYGTPANAWQHDSNLGWYGSGGMLGPGLSIVGDRGPELALSVGGQTQIISNSQTRALISAIKGSAPQNPWSTDVTNSPSSGSSSGQLNINFNEGSIQITASDSSSIASKAGREVAREIVKQISKESVSQAIRNGEKL